MIQRDLQLQIRKRGTKMGMDFRGQVWDMEDWAANPNQKFRRVPPPPPPPNGNRVRNFKSFSHFALGSRSSTLPPLPL